MNQVTLSIVPKAASAFAGGLRVSVSVGSNPSYQTVPAAQQPNGTWLATPDVQLGTETSFSLIPVHGVESKPYNELDTSRKYTPTDAAATIYAVEGIFGLCTCGPAHFAEPLSRVALMEAAFGAPVAHGGIFDGHEMPHGATLLGGDVYFVVHAPHAACATLILAVPNGAGGLIRQQVPMNLTQDNYYWWYAVPTATAVPGTKYRFLLNDNVEVIDPGARAVFDGGLLSTAPGEDPNDKATSWAVLLDFALVYNAAHVQAWQTMGWDNFLIYEMHAQRFTTLQQGATLPLDLLVDELSPNSRLGRTGYLRALPATVFELLPVNEFSSRESWGYDPAFYFAIDDFYGGAPAMARFVNAAHAAGRGVMLDVVYNHSLNSSLVVIARDVYRSGDYDGDKMNCGHPMMLEYFRQATVYLYRTFNLDGFRFDDT
jgi:1,4-alpha-glucan branching enzyme